MITFKDLTEWILKNRTRTSFKDYTELHIIGLLDRCAKDGSMLVINHGNVIEGVVCGELNHKEKIYFVHDILTIKSGIVKQMMHNFVHRFPGYTIKGIHRSGRERNFNSTKLYNRL